MKNKVNVLSIRNVIMFGGPDTTLIAWYAGIDKERFNIVLGSVENSGTEDAMLVDAMEANGIATRSIPYGPWKNLFAAVRKTVEIVRKEKIDIIHTHDHRSDMIGYLAARWAGTPVMSTIYVWFSKHSTAKMRYIEVVQRFFLRRFDGITAISEATRRDTIDDYDFPEDGVATILSGIDVAGFDGEIDEAEVRKSFGVSPDDRVLTYIARLWPEKAHTFLLQAMQKVVAEEPRVRLLALGDGILMEPLKAEVQERGLAANVTFTGIRRDVPEVLRITEFMVHPSLAEGIPLAVYEGMAAGLAIVGTDVDGIPEVVTHERTGLLVQPKDVDALAAAILRLLRDPELTRRLGKAARELMEEEYSLAHATAQLEDYYERLATK